MGIPDADSRLRSAWLVIGALTAFRAAGLMLSPVELHGDEAQYWSWSRTFDFGYFSKPPLIAWTIAATTAVFGNAEWAIRLFAPFAHAGAALFLMATARRRFGDRAAAWTGLIYITLPAVWLSAAVISTDALLLLAWSGGLWALGRQVDRPSWRGAAALGAFIGAGFMAKYAMIYFVIGLALLLILHAPTRASLVRRETLAGVGVAVALIAPNLVWNATHDFATLSHTAANANWGAGLFHTDMLVKFVLDQFGVFGPVTFAMLLASVVLVMRTSAAERARWTPLLVFVLPPLLIITAQAFLNRANANWAVAAYAAGTIFVVAAALEGPPLPVRLPGRAIAWRFGERMLAIALALHVAVGAVFVAAVLAPPFADAVGLANAFKRARGWETTTERVSEVFMREEAGAPYGAVLVDNRLLFHELEYYGRANPPPLRMWLRYEAPVSHAEAVAPLEPGFSAPVLVVSEREADVEKIRADFRTMRLVETVSVTLGGGRERRLQLFAAEGYAPLERGAEYEARWGNEPRRRDDAS